MNLRTSILVLAHFFLASFRLMCGLGARIAPLHKTKTCSKKKCTLTKILLTDLGFRANLPQKWHLPQICNTHNLLLFYMIALVCCRLADS